MLNFGAKKRIYLDYAAATPVRKEVVAVMQPFFSEKFANPSAIHKEGVATRNVINTAREKIARILHVRVPDIFFTGSGTESNNIAILGTVAERKKEGVEYKEMEVISTAIEHPSVLNTLIHLRSLGVTVHEAPVDAEGVIDIQQFRELLSEKTILVTFAYANSEIGTVQPVSKIARTVRSFEKEHDLRIYVHIDAAQAPLWLPCALDQLSVDMLSLDTGKCYGPKGVGVLAMRHGVTISPVTFGGGQEGGVRPGTENTPLIVGAAESIAIAQESYAERSEKVSKLRDEAILLLEQIQDVHVNGSRAERIANNINISVRGIDSEFAVVTLDEGGVACSTKSACSGADGGGSGVVKYITGDEKLATSTLRFTLGEDTTSNEIHEMKLLLQKHVDESRTIQKKLTSD